MGLGECGRRGGEFGLVGFGLTKVENGGGEEDGEEWGGCYGD